MAPYSLKFLLRVSASILLLAFNLNFKSHPFFKTKLKELLFNSILYCAYPQQSFLKSLLHSSGIIMYCTGASLIFVEMYLTLVLQWTFHVVMHFKVSKGQHYMAILESQCLNSTVACTLLDSKKVCRTKINDIN